MKHWGMNPIAERQLAELREKAGTGAALAQRVQTELEALAGTIRRVSPQQWQTVLPGREWTAAEEAEHIVLTNEGTARVLRLLLSDRELRPAPEVPVEYRPDGRRLAPAAVQPSGQATPQELLERIDALKAALNVQIDAASERRYFHPAYGPLDALDWLRIVPVHTRGHRKGIEAGLS